MEKSAAGSRAERVLSLRIRSEGSCPLALVAEGAQSVSGIVRSKHLLQQVGEILSFAQRAKEIQAQDSLVDLKRASHERIFLVRPVRGLEQLRQVFEKEMPSVVVAPLASRSSQR